jgi:superfamily II DNA or RNA helicase
VSEHSSTQHGVSALSGELADLKLETEYRTSDSDPAAEFYNPCLLRASTYDRAVGYFRSSVFAVSGPGVLDLAQRGGKIRLVCSPEITPEDWEAIERGHEDREHVLAAALARELDRLSESLETRRHTETLATLIRLGILELQIAIRSPRHGIFHEKLGIFGDHHGNAVSFKGSSNETWNGWHELGNLESIEVFCSWRDENERNRVERHRAYFERLWSGNVRGLEVVAIPEAFRLRLDTIAHSDLSPERNSNTNARTPLPHQEHALAAWRHAGCRGIFEHATGSGKTFTAILAIREHIESGELALVLVPSKLLLEQWAKELQRELPDATVLIAGAGRVSWKAPGRLERFTASRRESGPRIVLATMATATKDEFRNRIQSGRHLLMIADEVHQMGSPEYSRLMEIDSGKRLGLSATPRRFGDPVGTQRLLDYFQGIVPPPFTLRNAIESRRLVQYTYFPHPIYLSGEEADQWRDLTRYITREVTRSPKLVDGSFALSERAKLLLIRRARIAKKARGKIELARNIIRSEYTRGEHWLVYCEDSEQLGAVLEGLKSDGVDAKEYHTGMNGDPEGTLTWFTKFGGVLVSIRCLDEGVDIPQISHALILASSQNPRQFIQRRGRVLRASAGKYVAVVHDAIVIPADAAEEPEQMALARSEIARALEFADTSLNRAASAEIRDIAIRLGIDFESLATTGVEEDTDHDE